MSEYAALIYGPTTKSATTLQPTEITWTSGNLAAFETAFDAIITGSHVDLDVDYIKAGAMNKVDPEFEEMASGIEVTNKLAGGFEVKYDKESDFAALLTAFDGDGTQFTIAEISADGKAMICYGYTAQATYENSDAESSINIKFTRSKKQRGPDISKLVAMKTVTLS